MEKYAYKITVEPIKTPAGPLDAAPITFTAPCHEDILALAARVGADDDKKLRLLIGLKLLGEVLLKDRENPLNAEFLKHFGEFMHGLKGAGRK